MPRPSHPTIVSYLALFIALGGTSAYAAKTVFSTDIVDGEVKNADLSVNSVGSQKIIDGTIAAADMAAGSVTGDKLASAAVTGPKLDVGAVTSTKVYDETLGRFDIGPDAVTASELAPSAVTGTEILNGTVSANDLQPALVTRGLIAKADNEIFLDGGTFDNHPWYEVLSLSLPAGSYMLAGKATIQMQIGSGRGDCELRQGNAVLDRATAQSSTGIDDGTTTHTLALLGATTLTRGFALKMWCQPTLGYDMRVRHRRFTAIRVWSLATNP